MTAEMHLPRFFLFQKFAMTTNLYRVVAPAADGTPGELMALAQQKRLAFKEQVTFYTDESKSRPVFGFTARKKIDLNAGYDVVDEAGQPLGFFRKDFGASLLRSTFHAEGPDWRGTGRERSQSVGIIRRLIDVPLPIHFDFVDPDGRPLISVSRQMSLRDRYEVDVPDDRVDFRLAAAIAVGLDALMQR